MWSVWSFVLLVASPSTEMIAHTSPGLSLKVASYNAWLMPFGSDALFVRAAKMGPALATLGADVLCLQEAWYEDAAEAVRISLSHQLPHAVVGGGGLMTLSRWPVVRQDFVAFEAHPELSVVERVAKKGWLTTVLMTPLGPVEVVNTHLVWEGRRDDLPREQRAHWAQVQALSGALAHRRQVPVILCGDLNHRAVVDARPSDEFAVWLGLGFLDAAGAKPDESGRWTTRERTRVGYPRGPDLPPRGGDPDYILVRASPSLAVEVRAFRQAFDSPATALSDHNLLFAELWLTKRGPAGPK